MAVDLYQVVLGGIAVAIMVLVPILSVVFYDLLVGRWDESLRRWRERRSSRRRIGRPYGSCVDNRGCRSSNSLQI
jgi:hypothetical protein